MLAHDASGRASSERADTALQQASGPASSDKGKLRVFISYSRDDLKFADQLDASLEACGFDCVIDRDGISGGEDWKRRLGNLISEADTVVFVLSPSSARSEICDWEVEEAARLNKRILPVNCRPLEGVSPPPRLRDLNYMFFYEEPKVSGSGFGTGLASLITALNTDFDWLREHNRYLQRAIEWDKGGRPANRLLSGDDIAEAKAWAARRPKSAPEPTALHLDFIRASEEEAEMRSSTERKQLEAMAAAQAEREKALHETEEALKQAAVAQRKRARNRNIAFVAVSLLSLLIVIVSIPVSLILDMEWHFLSAPKNLDTANVEGPAEFELSHVGEIYAKGFGDYGKARELFEKAPHNAIGLRNLGELYRDGHGVAQDYAKARELFEKAAAKGDYLAMIYLGDLYRNGRVSQGDANARSHGDLHVYLNGWVSLDEANAREWYEKAAAALRERELGVTSSRKK